jgi:hypothetical protein
MNYKLRSQRMTLSSQRNVMFLLYFMSLLLMVSSLQSHHHHNNQNKCYGRRRRQQSAGIILFNVVDDSKSNNNNIPPVDSMRAMLESSWNTIKMGRIPVDAEAAAKEAYLSIIRAATGATTVDDNCEDIMKEEDDTNIVGTFFVDLLLPSYDIKQVQKGQTNLYDEVAAVEYCISLANCFEGKTQIIVRDDKTLQTVTKVLDARERNKNIMMNEDNNVDVKLDEEDHDDDDVDVDVKNDDENNESVGDDLFVGEETTTTTNNMDSYRQKLISNWDEQDPTTTSEDDPKSKSEDSTIETSSASSSSASSSSSSKKSYRLASLFGNVRIDQGPDMATRIIQALRYNALAKDDEDNIIILSAIGKDEMVAVRALVTKYGNEKKIILVNCQFQPTPRELLSAETVYSVLPLMARKNMENENNNNDNNNEIPPKVVVLRRYPKNWEIFVDVGNGYELAETVPINGSNKRGLSMQLIGRGVARHLDFVSRR